MKKQTGHEGLLSDVLDVENDLRGTTLEIGLAEVRRTRHRHRMARGLAAGLPIIALLALLMVRGMKHNAGAPEVPANRVIGRTERTIPGTMIQVISDEQLLQIFEGRPVALIGPQGNQRLVLLDEAAN